MSRRKELWQAFYPTYRSVHYLGSSEFVASIELDKFPDREVNLHLSLGDALRLQEDLESFIEFARKSQVENGGQS